MTPKLKSPREQRLLPQHCLAGLCVLGISLLLGGCADYNSQMREIREAWVAGNDEQAAVLAQTAATDKQESADSVVFGLEAATALRAAGHFEASSARFAAVETKMGEYAAGADIRIAAEAGATLTNLSYLPYTGTSYDKVMLSTYQALNDLQLGKVPEARVNLNRALEYQRDAVRENARELEEANKAAEGKHGDLNVDRSRSGAGNAITSAYADMVDLRAYADYVNPFTVLLDGLYFLYQGVDGSDLERARKSLERVHNMAEATTYTAQDLETVEAILRQQPLSPTTYVIFETGMVVHRQEIRIDIPLFIFGVRDVPYIGAAFPKLVPSENFIPYLLINADGKGYRTEQVCRMDSVVARQFDNDLPIIITKTLLSAGVKAAATYALAEAGRQAGNNDTGNLIGNLILAAGTAYQAIMNQADLRSWSTLPKFFAYARVPTPPNRKLTLTPYGAASSLVVDLEPALVNVVYAKSNSRQAPLRVFQFPLKPLPANF